jgi:5-methylcytosine-specific restriction endonuclease McrA
MKKEVRQAIFDKFGGRCAYCGELLGKGWHVDEIEPCRRRHKWDRENNKWVLSGYDHPDRLHIDNQFPACPSCNLQKHSMSLEDFRTSISNFVQSLNRYTNQYKFAKRYGLIEETKKPVVFYFETLS